LIDSIPTHTTGFVITFVDRFGHRDDNEGKGYWSLIYADGKPIPGAWSGVGDLLYGNWDPKKCPFSLANNLDSSRSFFLRDFASHPEMKRIYMRQYLATWKINDLREEQNFRKELESLQIPDLTETELQVLRNSYSRINDSLN
jgi:hypothetical protein